MARPDTTGMRKCQAVIPSKSKKDKKTGLMKTPRNKTRPCGKKAVSSYRVNWEWGNRSGSNTLNFCQDCDPDSAKGVPNAYGVRLHYGNITSITQIDQVATVEDDQVQHAKYKMIAMMQQRSSSKMSKELWLRACEEAYDEWMTSDVVSG